CCGRPLISKGFLHQARKLVQQQAPRLAQRLADGTPILGLEPSCLLTLADEWTELVPSSDTQKIAKAAELADVWLERQTQAGRARLELRPRRQRCLLHVHCHQKALRGTQGTTTALRLGAAPHLTVPD